jgi:sugar phosphate isomerase/epimerase
MAQVSYSSAGFEDRDIEAALGAIASVGFKYTELCGRAPHIAIPPTDEALVGFRDRLFARGLRASTVHGPTGRHVLGAPDATSRQETTTFLASYLRFAAAVEAPEIVIHPVPDPTSLSNPGHPKMPGRIRDAVLCSLDDLLPIAEETGVRMLLENLPYRCAFPFLSMRDGALRDRHWVPTHGDLDWEAIVSALRQMSYAGAWTFEAHRGRHGETSEEAARQCLQTARQWGL